jgi:hypothetical protein
VGFNRFKEQGFTFLALNPGWVNTDLAGEGTGGYVSITTPHSSGRVLIWFQQAPLQPKESISQCLKFVNRSTAADSGKFFTLDGREEAATN